MKNLGELVHYISQLSMPVPYIGIGNWEAVREEARLWCEDNDEKFECDPRLLTPNFIVFGIPIIQAGNA